MTEAVEKRENYALSSIFHQHNRCFLTAGHYFCVVVPRARVIFKLVRFKSAASCSHDGSVVLAMTSPTISGLTKAMHAPLRIELLYGLYYVHQCTVWLVIGLQYFLVSNCSEVWYLISVLDARQFQSQTLTLLFSLVKCPAEYLHDGLAKHFNIHGSLEMNAAIYRNYDFPSGPSSGSDFTNFSNTLLCDSKACKINCLSICLILLCV